MRLPVIDLGEWEELRSCPACGRLWLGVWPEELAGGLVVFRPVPEGARRLRDVDRVQTLRAYCLARLEEHHGELREDKLACKKVSCPRKRIRGTGYCIEHLIAERFGRHLARVDAGKTPPPRLR